MPIKSFEDLQVWQEGHRLVLVIYEISADFPKNESFGLTSQIRRAAVSVTSNIAEGFNRKGTKDKLQFYYISIGSLNEVKSQLIIARDLQYINNKKYDNIEEMICLVSRLLNGLIKSMKLKES